MSLHDLPSGSMFCGRRAEGNRLVVVALGSLHGRWAEGSLTIPGLS